MITDIPKKKFELLMRGTRDGFTSHAFHEKCDIKGPTLIVIKSSEHQRIFGGYTNIDWNSLNCGKRYKLQSFLFSLRP